MLVLRARVYGSQQDGRGCDGATVRGFTCTHTISLYFPLYSESCAKCSHCVKIFSIFIKGKLKDYLTQSIIALLVFESSDPPQHIMHATTDFAATSTTTPLQGSGSLDQFKSWEVTPCIGTEFQDVDLSEWITASDSDTLLKDLAILSINPPLL